jgi:hypothetical protein
MSLSSGMWQRKGRYQFTDAPPPSSGSKSKSGKKQPEFVFYGEATVRIDHRFEKNSNEWRQAVLFPGLPLEM